MPLRRRRVGHRLQAEVLDLQRRDEGQGALANRRVGRRQRGRIGGGILGPRRLRRSIPATRTPSRRLRGVWSAVRQSNRRQTEVVRSRPIRRRRRQFGRRDRPRRAASSFWPSMIATSSNSGSAPEKLRAVWAALHDESNLQTGARRDRHAAAESACARWEQIDEDEDGGRPQPDRGPRRLSRARRAPRRRRRSARRCAAAGCSRRTGRAGRS